MNRDEQSGSPGRLRARRRTRPKQRGHGGGGPAGKAAGDTDHVLSCRPLDGALPGIAIAEPADDGAVYAALDLAPMPATGEGSAPWLAPGSLGRMADVLAAGLSRLEPSSADIIANLAALKQKLLALKADADMALADADDLTAVALSPHFAYLSADLGIDLLASITAAPGEWPRRLDPL